MPATHGNASVASRHPRRIKPKTCVGCTPQYRLSFGKRFTVVAPDKPAVLSACRSHSRRLLNDVGAKRIAETLYGSREFRVLRIVSQDLPNLCDEDREAAV